MVQVLHVPAGVPGVGPRSRTQGWNWGRKGKEDSHQQIPACSRALGATIFSPPQLSFSGRTAVLLLATTPLSNRNGT